MDVDLFFLWDLLSVLRSQLLWYLMNCMYLTTFVFSYCYGFFWYINPSQFVSFLAFCVIFLFCLCVFCRSCLLLATCILSQYTYTNYTSVNWMTFEEDTTRLLHYNKYHKFLRLRCTRIKDTPLTFDISLPKNPEIWNDCTDIPAHVMMLRLHEYGQ